jgi:hypothetical protein
MNKNVGIGLLQQTRSSYALFIFRSRDSSQQRDENHDRNRHTEQQQQDGFHACLLDSGKIALTAAKCGHEAGDEGAEQQ